jgi:hypothetical protein
MFKGCMLALLGFAAGLMGCSDSSLSRFAARQILSDYIGHPVALADPVIFVSVGRFSETGNLNRYCDDPISWPVEITEARQQRMELAGLIRVEKHGCKWDIGLTDLGKAYASGPPTASGLQMIRVASFQGWNVTGVERKGLTARVQVAAYFALNPAGAALQQAGYREVGAVEDDPKMLVQTGDQELVLVAGSWRVVPAPSTGAN